MNKYLRFLYWLESWFKKRTEPEDKLWDKLDEIKVVDEYVENAKQAGYVEVNRDERSN